MVETVSEVRGGIKLYYIMSRGGVTDGLLSFMFSNPDRGYRKEG